MYAILDIETRGQFNEEPEIAIYKLDGHEIDQFISLILHSNSTFCSKTDRYQ
jgi:hypothetical protein